MKISEAGSELKSFGSPRLLIRYILLLLSYHRWWPPVGTVLLLLLVVSLSDLSINICNGAISNGAISE